MRVLAAGPRGGVLQSAPMSRKDRTRGARIAAIGALLEAGDHAAAAEAARRVLADAAATPDERAAAEGALGSLRPEPLAVRVGLGAGAAAAVLAAWAILRS